MSKISANFVIATLYDNDFHSHLMDGVPYIANHAEDPLMNEEDFKKWLVNFVVFYSSIRVINKSFFKEFKDLEHTYNYVQQNLKVWYSITKPNYVDENFEMVMHDCRLNYTWSA
jgi:hypothetical protein